MARPLEVPRKLTFFVLILSSLTWSSLTLLAAEPPAAPEITPLDVPPPIVTAETPPPAPPVMNEAPSVPVPEAKKAPDLPPPAPTQATPTVAAPSPPAVNETPQAMTSPEPVASKTPVVEASPEPTPTAPPVAQEAPPPRESPKSFPWSEAGSRALLREYARDYQLKRPAWGAQLEFSPNALGKTDISGNGGNVYPRAFQIGVDYQPKFLQTFGVFSFGPEITVFPILPMNQNVAQSVYSIWSYGGEMRYQARFFREQILVPVGGFDYERLQYNLKTSGHGSFNLKGGIIGLYILTNPLEPSAAYDLYQDTGILRTYLTLEFRNLKGSDQNLNISGTSYYAGLRMEF